VPNYVIDKINVAIKSIQSINKLKHFHQKYLKPARDKTDYKINLSIDT
jgi:hypothetical protein